MKKGFRLQSAMEYLMTYGWAILIIAVVLGALFQLGVFNSSSFSPRAPPGACQVFRPSGPGTTTNINLMGVCTGQLPQYIAQFGSQINYIDAGSSTAFNLQNAVTISVWAKIIPGATLGGHAEIVSRSSSWDFTNWDGYDIYPQNTEVLLDFVVKGDAMYRLHSTLGDPRDGKWHQYVGTYSSTFTRYYIDGVQQQASATNGRSFTNTWNGNFEMGRYLTYVDNSFNGMIANVQFYNASLSSNEIQAMYLGGIGGAPLVLQNLAGWWPLNGNANDYSGNNNNGVPTGVTFTSQYGK